MLGTIIMPKKIWISTRVSIETTDPIAAPTRRPLNRGGTLMLHTLLFTFLCYATGNVFRPTKSHAGQTTTQREGIDGSDQPNTKNLCLSAAVWKPLPVPTERKNSEFIFDVFPLRSISRFLPND